MSNSSVEEVFIVGIIGSASNCLPIISSNDPSTSTYLRDPFQWMRMSGDSCKQKVQFSFPFTKQNPI
jgi:hypothetical protein